MAKDQGVNIQPSRNTGRSRTTPAKPVLAGAGAPDAVAAPKKRVSPAQFLREVRVEGRKTTWTPWRETWITSVMVLIMVALTAAFFSIVDGVFSFLMQQILKLAG